MKITRLYLKNFIALDVTQHKKEIEIIFPEDKVIHILYGPMGSGKTFILGHCQPWHTFGTLDVRNSDPQILPEEDGQKIFECTKGKDYYVFTHDYIWNGKSHNTKHYFKKNGKELNPNGNLSTFNELMKLEFGIDQEYLRLIRIGDNVGNLIKLKSTERKKYIASRLSETEVYLLLYKKISQDLKVINAEVGLLVKKLTDLHFEKYNEMKAEKQNLESKLFDLEEKCSQFWNYMYALEYDAKNLMDGMDKEEFTKAINALEEELYAEIEELRRMEIEWRALENESKPEELQKEIGTLDEKMRTAETNLHNKSNEFDKIRDSLHSLEEEIAIHKNEEQMNLIEERYQALLKQIEEMEHETKFYPYNDSFQSLLNLESDVTQINSLLYMMSSYKEEDIIKVYHSDESIVRWAEKKVQILEAKKRKAKAEATNYQFSATYIAPSAMFIPPFCPTEDCPYRKTHPLTLQMEAKKKEVESIVQARLSEVDSLDIEIYRYLEYSSIYSQMKQLKTYWNRCSSHLSRLKVLRQDHLDLILTKNKNWIDGDKLTKWIGLAQKKDELLHLRDQMVSIKDEINRMKLSGIDELERKKEELSKEKESLLQEIKELNYESLRIESAIKDRNDRYLKVSQLSVLKEEWRQRKDASEDKKSKLLLMIKNKEKAEENLEKVSIIKKEYEEMVVKKDRMEERLDFLRATLSQIEMLDKDHIEAVRKQKLYSYIVEAVSPKDGIPLQLVAMYLNECTDTVNDLISDVFDDNLEIEKFDVNEEDFTIPYIVGGKRIEDVSRCSQGEKSIIGIAISFAMMNDPNVSYDIPLLDEVDAPLHGSDRNKFMMLMAKWIHEKGIQQTIMITHNQIFEGYPINLILTSEENFDSNEVQSVYRV